ncbi:MAG: TetR/AcrR family transcriptional regulator [Gammaproteobacteria bacterium]|nr:TetR/AcrR family transcriptional regulator [Gammaproteobacteria bacterium]NNC96835.1 TetR/AcrR family transcriptional regulator [Gammaproteobacteria bacterium]NNM14088.1 TetR/AcrR family transcriptional regulator [Gammaproteobacteria bacterium]
MAKKTHQNSDLAKDAILDATEAIVAESGPAGLRISAVAKKAGMAHPNIIYHFGSRAGLMSALAKRVSDAATTRITQAIRKSLDTKPENLVQSVSHVLDTAYQGEQGKLAIWLALSGTDNSIQDNMHQIVEMAHQLRLQIDPVVKIENTKKLVMLVTMALIGDVVMGERLQQALEFGEHDSDYNFKNWLANLLLNISDQSLN